MNGWTKHFLDNTTEVGTDDLTASKLASWSKGRLTNMCGASITHQGMHITLKGLGEYWQSDDYEVRFGDTFPKVVVRRLQKKILDSERVFQILETDHSVMLRTIDMRINSGEMLIAETLRGIDLSEVGKWLTIELDTRTNKIRWYFTEDKI